MARRAGPRRDTPRASRTTFLGLAVVGVLAVTGWVMLKLYDGVPLRGYETVYVSTPMIGNLLPHDAVRIGGKRVGQVIAVDIGRDGRPRLQLQLDPGTRVPEDTRVRIRASGLLGARYVQLAPGGSTEVVRAGGTLRGDESSYALGIPEAVDVFNRETRRGLRTTMGELGAGFHGNGAGLNASIGQLSVAAGEFDEVARAVLSRSGAAARLLPSLRSGLRAADRSRPSVRTFPGAVADGVEPFITERGATRDALARAPAALRAADSGLGRGRALMSALRELSTAATGTLPPAPAGLRETTALLRESPAVLRRARPTVATVGPAARGATRFLVAAEPLVPVLDKTLDLGEPFLEYLGRYACDVVNAAAVLRSMTGYGQSGSGPGGPAMAFRLEAVVPAGLEAVGLEDGVGLLKRDGYAAPCKYISRPYPQLLSLPRKAGR